MAFMGRFPRTKILGMIAEGYGWEDICEMLDIRAPENIQRVRAFVGSKRRKGNDHAKRVDHGIGVVNSSPSYCTGSQPHESEQQVLDPNPTAMGVG